MLHGRSVAGGCDKRIKCVVEIFWCFAYAFSTTFVILEHHNYISNIVILFLILL
jgi:hypothetical protein